MSSILGEWREVESRPLQGKAPHDRPVSRGISCSLWGLCVNPFPATRFPLLLIPGARYAFSQAWRNLSVRCSRTTTKSWVRAGLPPAGPARTQAKERAGRITFLSSSAMSSDRLFLDRVGRHQSPSPLHRHGQTNTTSLQPPSKQDISTLQRIIRVPISYSTIFRALKTLGITQL
jgi:hypothetical protein